MNLLDVTVSSAGLGHARASFYLGGGTGSLSVDVTTQGEYRRVRGVWLPAPSNAAPVEVLLGYVRQPRKARVSSEGTGAVG